MNFTDEQKQAINLARQGQTMDRPSMDGPGMSGGGSEIEIEW